MKTFKYYFVLLSAMLLGGLAIACSSDDDDDEVDAALVGTWAQTYSSYSTGFKFNSNGTCYYGEWGRYDDMSEVFEHRMSYKTSGSTLTITDKDDGEVDKYVYTYSVSKDGKTLTLEPNEKRSTGYLGGGTYTRM